MCQTNLKIYKDIKILIDLAQCITGGCCQWQCSSSYDSEMHIETVVLRKKFSDEPPNSTPPER